jgi:septum formation protein
MSRTGKRTARHRLILASASAGRRELLAEAGFVFEVCPVPAEVEEAALAAARARGASAEELALAAARAKAGAAVTAAGPGSVVLAADTLVRAADGTVLGKGNDAAGSAAILRQLAGTLHRVISGVALLAPGPVRHEFVSISEVRMAPMTDGEIADYVGSGRSVGASGGYRIQRDGPDRWLRVESGSVSNVVGLPLEEIMPLLAALGVRPRAAFAARRCRGRGGKNREGRS